MCLISYGPHQPEHQIIIMQQQQLTGGAGNPLPSSAMVLSCQLNTQTVVGRAACRFSASAALAVAAASLPLLLPIPTTHETVAHTLR